jgi:hypothetical protein
MHVKSGDPPSRGSGPDDSDNGDDGSDGLPHAEKSLVVSEDHESVEEESESDSSDSGSFCSLHDGVSSTTSASLRFDGFMLETVSSHGSLPALDTVSSNGSVPSLLPPSEGSSRVDSSSNVQSQIFEGNVEYSLASVDELITFEQMAPNAAARQRRLNRVHHLGTRRSGSRLPQVLVRAHLANPRLTCRRRRPGHPLRVFGQLRRHWGAS